MHKSINTYFINRFFPTSMFTYLKFARYNQVFVFYILLYAIIGNRRNAVFFLPFIKRMSSSISGNVCGCVLPWWGTIRFLEVDPFIKFGCKILPSRLVCMFVVQCCEFEHAANFLFKNFFFIQRPLSFLAWLFWLVHGVHFSTTSQI